MKNRYTGWECEDCEGKGFLFVLAKYDDIESVERCDTCQKFNNDDEAREFTEEYYYRVDQVIYDL